MSRKNNKARKLKRNKKVRRARRAAKSKWKWVIPTIIFLCMTALFYYKIALTQKYTSTATLYNKVDKAYTIVEECVTSSSIDTARFRTKIIKGVLSMKSIEIKEVEVIEGCDNTIKTI